MSRTRYLRYLICCVSVLLAVSAAFAQNETQDAARRHMIRGVAAIEMAKTESDLRAAADEFRRATEIDPKLAGAWYNLAAVQAKLQDHAGAIASFKRYLELEPSSEDAPKVRDEIVKLEYRLERSAKQQSLAGKWSGDSTTYNLTINGNGFRMQSEQPASWNPWAEKSLTLYFKDMFATLNERTPKKIEANVSYEGRLDGDRITGERVRDSYDDEESSCRIPAHRAAFEGKIEQDGDLITVTFEEPHYRAEYSAVFFGMQNCSSVSVDGTIKREKKYFRQKMLSVGLDLGPSEKGGVRTVRSVVNDSTAGWMGVTAGDQLLAIDGQDVSSLSDEQIRGRLQGIQGKIVRVRLNRSGWSKPVEIPLACGPALYYGLNGSVGLWIRFSLESRDGSPAWQYKIEKIHDAGSAAEAKLRVGDEVVLVDGQDITSKPFLEGIALMNGEPGSTVRITVQAANGSRTEYTLTRRTLTWPSGS